jgi:hypothetical protein
MTFSSRLLPLLTEILILDRETAIYELGQLKQNITADEYRVLVRGLSRKQETRLVGINRSEINRRKVTGYSGFKLGDVVTTNTYKSLAGIELTIVEFEEPWVHCLFPSGSSSPGLLVEDLNLVAKTCTKRND